jgi:hypothetical protein
MDYWHALLAAEKTTSISRCPRGSTCGIAKVMSCIVDDIVQGVVQNFVMCGLELAVVSGKYSRSR